jgi:uncharacterized protein
MMRERINAALKQAMLDKDKRKTSTLRLISAAIKDRDIAARGAGRDPVSDDDILEILAKMIRQRLESEKLYEEGGRVDLATQEREEVAIIKSFLPRQIDEDEMRALCAEAIKSTGSQGLRDMGRCMQALRAEYAGRMDFGKASLIVKEKLG